MNLQLYQGKKQTIEEINLMSYLDRFSNIKKAPSLLSTNSVHGVASTSNVEDRKKEALTITQQIQLAASMKLGHIKSNATTTRRDAEENVSSVEVNRKVVAEKDQYEARKSISKSDMESKLDNTMSGNMAVEKDVENGSSAAEDASLSITDNHNSNKTPELSEASAPSSLQAQSLSNFQKDSDHVDKKPDIPTSNSVDISHAMAGEFYPTSSNSAETTVENVETGRIAKKAKISLAAFAASVPPTTASDNVISSHDSSTADLVPKKTRINRNHELDPLQFPSLCMLMKDSFSTNRIAKIAGVSSSGEPMAVVVPFKEYILDNFGLSMEKSNDITRNKQTLVMKLTTPSTCSRWSLNICPPSRTKNPNLDRETSYTEAVNWGEVMLHFNPRCSSKSLLLTDKCIMWSKHKRTFDARQPECNWVNNIMPGETFELMIQIYPGGFAIFINAEFCCFYAHRSDMQTYASTSYYLDQRPPHLVLQVNLVEEISDAVENVTVHKIWWGHRDYAIDQNKIEPQLLEKCLLMPVEADVIESHARMYQCCIKVEGLPIVNKADDTKALEHLLYELYESIDYSVIEGVYVPKDRGCGYVRFPVGTDIQPAIEATNNQQILDEPTQKTCTLLVSALLDK